MIMLEPDFSLSMFGFHTKPDKRYTICQNNVPLGLRLCCFFARHTKTAEIPRAHQTNDVPAALVDEDFVGSIIRLAGHCWLLGLFICMPGKKIAKAYASFNRKVFLTIGIESGRNPRGIL